MFRNVAMAALALTLTLPLPAQAQTGWEMRVDHSTNPTDPDDVPEVTITPVDDGFEVYTGPAVTMWSPSNSASGEYTLEGTFTLLEPSGHLNYYGLVYGGRQLEGSQQSYIYFLVAQNGSYTIRHRADDETVHDIQGRTPHEAVTTPDANGQSVNHLQVRVGSDGTQYVVNGTVVHTASGGMAGLSDGIYGVRVNHVIPGVRIEGLRVTG